FVMGNLTLSSDHWQYTPCRQSLADPCRSIFRTLREYQAYFDSPRSPQAWSRQGLRRVSTTGSKITLLMLDLPKVRFGSRGFGVRGSFAECALASTFRLPLDPVPHNVLSGVEESRSAGKADGRLLRWLDYVPCA